MKCQPIPALTTLPIVDSGTGRRYRVRPQLLRGRHDEPRAAVIVEPLRALDEDDVLVQLGLTDREADVATVTMKGLTTKYAAIALGMAPNTVEHHLGNIFEKLDVASRSEMAAMLLGSSAGQRGSTMVP